MPRPRMALFSTAGSETPSYHNFKYQMPRRPACLRDMEWKCAGRSNEFMRDIVDSLRLRRKARRTQYSTPSPHLTSRHCHWAKKVGRYLSSWRLNNGIPMHRHAVNIKAVVVNSPRGTHTPAFWTRCDSDGCPS